MCAGRASFGESCNDRTIHSHSARASQYNNAIQFNSIQFITLHFDRMQKKDWKNWKTGSEKIITTLVGFQLVPEHEVPRLSPCVTINFHMIQSIIAYIWTPVVIAEGKVADYYNTRDALRPLAKICHEACRYFIIPLDGRFFP